MNPYKLNGKAGHYFRNAICNELNLLHSEIYKEVKDLYIDEGGNSIIITKDNKKFKLKLEEI